MASRLASFGSLNELAQQVHEHSKRKYKGATIHAAEPEVSNPFVQHVQGSFSLHDGHEHSEAARFDDEEDEAEMALRSRAGSRSAWDHLLFCLNLYLVVSIPFCLSFGSLGWSDASWEAWLGFNALVDALLLLDMAVRVVQSLLLSYSYANELSEVDDVGDLKLTTQRTSPLKEFLGDPVAMHRPSYRYHRSYTLLGDALFFFPLDYVALSAGVSTSAIAAYRIPRFGRVLRVIMHVYYWGPGSATGAVRRLLKASFAIVLLSHWLACLWLAVSVSEGYVERHGLDEAPISKLYRLSFYWALTQTIKAPTDAGLEDLELLQGVEFGVATASMILGLVVFVMLVGEVSSIIALADNGVSEHRGLVLATERFCERNRLPHSLRVRMLRHLEFTHARGASEDKVLSNFSSAIRKDCVLYLCSDLVARVPFFQGVEPGFLHSIVLLLQRESASSGDVVVWQGELQTSIGFVSRGSLEEWERGSSQGEEKRKVVRSLVPGSYFGELGMLLSLRHKSGTATPVSSPSSGPRASMRSPTSITACKFSELYNLSYADVLRVVSEFPSVRQRLLDVAHSSVMKRISRACSAEDAKKTKELLMATLASPKAATTTRVSLAPLSVPPVPEDRPTGAAGESSAAVARLEERVGQLEAKVSEDLAALKQSIDALVAASSSSDQGGGD